MIRIAAVGDLHFDRSSRHRLSRHFKELEGKADILLLAGDLTQTGHVEEAHVLAADLSESPVKVVAVFGNHDYHCDQSDLVRAELEEAGVTVLERECAEFELSSIRIGIVGLKGFGGGFVGACATDFGEAEMKSFIRTTKAQANYLREALAALETDYRIALLHYSPVPDTLHGEKREIYPFLGSYLLGEAIDEGGADIAFHGHAHGGIERGTTVGGVPVRNVAMHVIRHVFNIYTLDKDGSIVAHAGLVPRAQPVAPH